MTKREAGKRGIEGKKRSELMGLINFFILHRIVLYFSSRPAHTHLLVSNFSPLPFPYFHDTNGTAHQIRVNLQL
jgi:hypothetical protein